VKENDGRIDDWADNSGGIRFHLYRIGIKKKIAACHFYFFGTDTKTAQSSYILKGTAPRKRKIKRCMARKGGGTPYMSVIKANSP